ncbi:uncharacterized protein LOC143284549 [Babylonia areolata]|uniref:uncharacterized protein LOC143284549 n=1 Tax=Babylonia areolata TaxID=304850 RepID=UPI003FD620F8
MEQQVKGDGQIVVLAVDDSKHSEFAFQYYVNDVYKPGFVLHVVHCAEAWGPVQPMDGGPSPAHVQELKAKDEKAVEQVKQKFTKLMADNQVCGEFHLVNTNHKDSWHSIIQHQEKVGAVMIVMGSRGQGAIRRTVMGSVSDSVVHHAKCPVLVCRK